MKNVIVVMLILGLLNYALAPAYGKNFAEDLAEAFVKIYAAVAISQMVLCIMAGTYYLKFNEWPSNYKEFKERLLSLEEDAKEKDPVIKELFNNKDAADKGPKKSFSAELTELCKAMNFEFNRLPEGDVLIEGGFSEVISKSLESAGLGKCLISIIGRRTPEGFSFTPSGKAKGNRDYISIPLNFKVKNSGINKK